MTVFCVYPLSMYMLYLFLLFSTLSFWSHCSSGFILIWFLWFSSWMWQSWSLNLNIHPSYSKIHFISSVQNKISIKLFDQEQNSLEEQSVSSSQGATYLWPQTKPRPRFRSRPSFSADCLKFSVQIFMWAKVFIMWKVKGCDWLIVICALAQLKGWG